MPQKQSNEIDKNIKKLITTNTEIISNSDNIIPIENTKTNNNNNLAKDAINNDSNTNLKNNDNNKISNHGTIDQLLLNSLLNTSKAQNVELQQHQPSLVKDPLGFNTLNQYLQSQLINTNNPVAAATIPVAAVSNNIQAQVLAQAILQQQQQQSSLKIENNDPKKGAVPLGNPEADKWLYLDPQNQIQGTFTSEEMAAWFAAGYFTLTLMIKRGCDDQFLPLG